MTQSEQLPFPGDPFFENLLRNAQLYSHVIIADAMLGIQATYKQLLHDVNNLRAAIRQNLLDALLDLDGNIRKDEVFFGVLIPGNYEFVVALVASLAMGAAIIPFPTGLLPEEACELIARWDVVCTLVGSEQGTLLAASIEESRHCTTFIQVATQTARGEEHFRLSDQLTFSPERSGLLLLTSGTTGPPKGVVHARRFFYSGQGSSTPCSPSDVFLLNRPITIVDQSSSTRPSKVWERLRSADLHLMLYYQNTLSILPAQQLAEYIQDLRALRVAQSTGWMPPPVVKEFWYNLRGGKAIEVAYASTEAGVVITSSTLDMFDIDACIGSPVPGVEIRLSNNIHGEILVQTPTMLKGYHNNIPATQAAFNGKYFRSGDIAQIRDDGRFVIDGRASTGFARFCGLVVPLIDVESAISRLPYIEEAHILAVSDPKFQSQVGTIIRTNSGCSNLALSTVRHDLSPLLPLYKLPTLLYVLEEHDYMPRTVSGKLDVKRTLETFFGCSGDYSEIELPDGVQRWEITTLWKERRGPWDWDGLQV
ncbi:acetyl-CoA synthetase-like protein [Aspergillus californicus]